MIGDTGGDEERLAKNEVLFRAVNEAIEQQALRFGGIEDEYEFVCECSAADCVERVTLTLRQYEQVRAEGTRFILAPGHADPEVELVVHRTATMTWWIRTGLRASSPSKRIRAAQIPRRISDRRPDGSRGVEEGSDLLVLLLAICQHTLLALEAAENVLDTDLTEDLTAMIDRTEAELAGLKVKLETASP